MAKFLKSLLTSEQRSISYEPTTEEDRSDRTSMEVRRNLSVSRSGRMRQAQKKRRSLHLDHYGDENIIQESQKNKEYHVNPQFQAPTTLKITTSKQSRISAKCEDTVKDKKADVLPEDSNKQTQKVITVKTPEEEIDIAFQVIDKSIDKDKL